MSLDSKNPSTASRRSPLFWPASVTLVLMTLLVATYLLIPFWAPPLISGTLASRGVLIEKLSIESAGLRHMDIDELSARTTDSQGNHFLSANGIRLQFGLDLFRQGKLNLLEINAATLQLGHQVSRSPTGELSPLTAVGAYLRLHPSRANLANLEINPPLSGGLSRLSYQGKRIQETLHAQLEGTFAEGKTLSMNLASSPQAVEVAVTGGDTRCGMTLESLSAPTRRYPLNVDCELDALTGIFGKDIIGTNGAVATFTGYVAHSALSDAAHSLPDQVRGELTFHADTLTTPQAVVSNLAVETIADFTGNSLELFVAPQSQLSILPSDDLITDAGPLPQDSVLIKHPVTMQLDTPAQLSLRFNRQQHLTQVISSTPHRLSIQQADTGKLELTVSTLDLYPGSPGLSEARGLLRSSLNKLDLGQGQTGPLSMHTGWQLQGHQGNWQATLTNTRLEGTLLDAPGELLVDTALAVKSAYSFSFSEDRGLMASQPFLATLDDTRIDGGEWILSADSGTLAIDHLALTDSGPTLEFKLETPAAALQYQDITTDAVQVLSHGLLEESRYSGSLLFKHESPGTQFTGRLLAQPEGGGSGSLRFLGEIGDQPTLTTLLPAEAANLELTSGRIALKSDFSWQDHGAPWETLSQSSHLDLSELSGEFNDIGFSGLGLQADLTGSQLSQTPAPARFRLGSLDALPGLTQMDGQALLQLDLGQNHLKAFEGNFRGNFFGGKVLLPELNLDTKKQTAETTFYFQGLQLSQLTALSPSQDLEISGTIDGFIPVRLSDGRWTITDGKVAAVQPGGILRYQQAEDGAGETALEVLENFHYHKLGADLNLSEDGNLVINIHMAGHNPEHRRGRPFIFNLNVEQNADDLYRSVMISRGVLENVPNQ